MTDIITYETIRNVHRNEKAEQLSKLPDGFWPAARAWLAAKEQRQDSTSLLEADSAKKLLEDIVNRRQRKTVVAALATARGAVPPQNMTLDEAKFFDQMVAMLKSSAHGALENIFGAATMAEKMVDEARAAMQEIARHAPAPEQYQETEPLKSAGPAERPTEQIPRQTPVTDSYNSGGGVIPEQDADLKSPPTTRKVKMISALPQFVGPADQKVYGPFQAGDVAELPAGVATLLAGRGAAEIVES